MPAFRPISIGISACLLMSTSAISSEPTKMTLSGSTDALHMDYLGDRNRIGVGVNTEGDLNGEILYVFSEKNGTAWLGEAWLGSEGAGGLKLNYHWLDSDKDYVYKAFAAVDQNGLNDRKMTIGGGLEKEDIFFDGYFSAAITDKRLIHSNSATTQQQLSGTDSIGSYLQTQTTTTLTRVYEKPYDLGIGMKIGRYFDEYLMRARAGVDYEWGDYNSDQLTFSLGLEKFIAGTGHSLALNVEALNRSGDFMDDSDDMRGSLTWRYAFGETYRPRYTTKKVQKPVEQITSKTQQTYQVIKNQVDITTDTFFDIDSAALREASKQELKRIAEILANKELLGKISIVGHTCNLGDENYNFTLSERRAVAVKNQLIAYGVSPDAILTEGRGESQPRYSNDTLQERKKNRRVDIHFLAIEETNQTLPAESSTPEMQWVQETVESPSAWRERALVNPVMHKRQVDVYRFEKTSVNTELSDQEYTDLFPSATDDQAQARRNGGAVLIDVLSNDTSPDNDAITIASISQPSGGSVENFGDILSFTPLAGFSGLTAFTYTLRDTQGAESQASVTINVINDAPTANDDESFTAQDTAVTIDVLANDNDPNGDALEIISTTQPENGSASIQDGKVVYQPNANFLGTDTFTYSVRDEAGSLSTGQINVTVSDIPNNPPVARNDHHVTAYLSAITVNVLANDFDPDGDTLTVIGIDNLPSPDIATYEINGDGTITMRPTGWSGKTLLTIQYTISDGRGGIATADLSIIDP